MCMRYLLTGFAFISNLTLAIKETMLSYKYIEKYRQIICSFKVKKTNEICLPV